MDALGERDGLDEGEELVEALGLAECDALGDKLGDLDGLADPDIDPDALGDIDDDGDELGDPLGL